MRPMPAHLGEFEQLVLLALLRLDDAGYGVTVRAMLEQRAHRRVSLGTVYKTLLRLEAKGLVAARVRARLEQGAHRRVTRGRGNKPLLRLGARGLGAAGVGEPTPERGSPTQAA